MTRSPVGSRLLGSAMLLAATGTIALAQNGGTRPRPKEFGTQDYTATVISAAAFTSDTAYATDASSLFRIFPMADGGHYYAGVNVPSGVIIDYVGLECASTGTGELTATLLFQQRGSGTTDAIATVANTPHSFGTDYNPSPLGYELVHNSQNALMLDVYQLPNTGPLFGWVEIWWRRVVSPPPATATFSDVPTSHPFFQFIEAIRSAGITVGCGDGNFCPDQPITRKQEAAFIAQALGLFWPDSF